MNWFCSGLEVQFQRGKQDNKKGENLFHTDHHKQSFENRRGSLKPTYCRVAKANLSIELSTGLMGQGHNGSACGFESLHPHRDHPGKT